MPRNTQFSIVRDNVQVATPHSAIARKDQSTVDLDYVDAVIIVLSMRNIIEKLTEHNPIRAKTEPCAWGYPVWATE